MDEQEFRLLLDEHADGVRAFIWRRSGGLDAGVSDAEDINADVWSTAWQRRDTAPAAAEPAAARAWLLQIARHTLANHIRKTTTRRGITPTLKQEELTLASAESIVLAEESIRRVFDVLTPAEKEVMALAIWEDLRPGEIAVVIGATTNAVSLRLHKARAKIEELLREKD